jgi:hypothetical protein
MTGVRGGATLSGRSGVRLDRSDEREAMTTITIRGAAAAVASAAVLGSAFVVPAQAKIIGEGVDQINDSYTDSCGQGYAVSGQIVGTETYVDKFRGGDVTEFKYLDPWFTFNVINTTETVTNTDTGKFFTAVVKNSSSRDQRLLSVEGSEQTYRRFGTRHFTVYRADGGIHYASNGRFQFDYVYDTQGTEGTDDDTDAFIDGSFRFNGIDPGADFCADVIALTS